MGAGITGHAVGVRHNGGHVIALSVQHADFMIGDNIAVIVPHGAGIGLLHRPHVGGFSQQPAGDASGRIVPFAGDDRVMIPGEAQDSHLLALHVVRFMDRTKVRAVISLVNGGKPLPVARHIRHRPCADWDGRVMVGVDGIGVAPGRHQADRHSRLDFLNIRIKGDGFRLILYTIVFIRRFVVCFVFGRSAVKAGSRNEYRI